VKFTVVKWRYGMKNLVKEFKEFALGGNLIETGVALVMALALAAVITSLVENVLMPIVGIIFGEPSFDSLTLTVNGSVILYGSFITAFVSFLAVAFAVYFMIVKPYNAYRERVSSGEEEEPAAPSEEIVLLREIRDSLAK
jgi:large conductance mechanosensitive channel